MKYNIIIIGGGIVGLATALRLKKNNPKLKIIVLEKEKELAKHQTGNNSGVIHSGIYYKPGSLKAINCRLGYKQLIDFCNKEDISYELCGKLIVATKKEELPILENLLLRGRQNGLSGIKKIKGNQIQEYEPHATGIAAIHVPETGIIDYSEVALKYAKIFCKKYGGQITLNEKVTDIKTTALKAEVITQKQTYQTDLVINTSGLYCDKIAKLTQDKLDVKIIPFRGEYVELSEEKQHLVKNLIYPVPNPNFPFLGVHFTRMIHGGIEAGPNAVWAFKREGYNKFSFQCNEFLESLLWPGFLRVMKQYWEIGIGEYYRSFFKTALAKELKQLVPEIESCDLKTGGAGVRAQACHRNGKLIDDFMIIEDKHILNVLNAPSPAATASLAIGNSIAEMAHKRMNL